GAGKGPRRTKMITQAMITDTDVDRFAAKIEFPPDGPEDTASCWFWAGARHSRRRGYGKFWLSGRMVNAHKASYLLFRGDVAEGQVVGHLCNCESCVNPFHLVAQSQAE